jgi:hypothetical protein
MKLTPLLGIALLSFAASAAPGASAWYLHANGSSYHFNRRDLNEENWGVGVTYAFDVEARWGWAIEADYFKDSFGDPSGYAGGSFRRRFKYADVGLLGFVMYRESAEDNIGSKVFPGVLPFVEVGTDRIRLRTAYIPAVTGRDDEAVTFQLLIRL